MIKQEFIAEGMHCNSCPRIISKQALKLKGVKTCKIIYSSQIGIVEFDPKKTDIDEILYKIEELGYECKLIERNDSDNVKFQERFKSGILIISVLIFGYYLFNTIDAFNLPTISKNMSYGILFLVGLFTGLHCIAMCGGFVVSYTAHNTKNNKSSTQSHIYYAIGKTLSYTIIGAIFGLIGSIIAFTPMMRGVSGILAGIFLLIFGLNMLNMLNILKKFRLKTPKFIQSITKRYSNKNSSPLKIGLLNGLMIACGPLQAIYIMAAGSGSMIDGAIFLFIFGIGTLPAMLGFAYFTSYLSSKFTNKILKGSGLVVIVLGIIMINNGLALAGTGYDLNTIVTSLKSDSISGVPRNEIATLNSKYQEIRMDVTRYGWEPDNFVLKKGVPVKWIINGKEITGCNNAIQVPKYGLEFDIKQGEQVIEFTPDEVGTVSWSCWMGMIQGTFIVKDNINKDDIVTSTNQNNKKQAMGCGCSCGSNTCTGGTSAGCGCRKN